MKSYTAPRITVAGSVRSLTRREVPGQPLEAGSLVFAPDPVVIT